MSSNLRRGHLPGSTIKPQVKLPKDPAGCWEYLGSIDKKTGYGKKQWHGKTYLAHRWIWMMLFGPIPDNLPLHNTCGNLACVSPHHWVISTQAGINRDNIASVLTAGDVVEIKRVPKAERTTRAQRAMAAHRLAERFGCSRQLIYDVWAGRAWGRTKPEKRETLPHPYPESEAA
jgi:hypothetical protein